MKLEAIAIDGTAIEFERAQFGKHGATLERRTQQGQQPGPEQSQQSNQSQQDNLGQRGTEQEVIIVFEEDVPEAERAQVERQLEETEAKSTQQSTGESSDGPKQQSSSQSKSSENTETIGFISSERLMYVVPEDIAHTVDEMGTLPS